MIVELIGRYQKISLELCKAVRQDDSSLVVSLHKDKADTWDQILTAKVPPAHRVQFAEFLLDQLLPTVSSENIHLTAKAKIIELVSATARPVKSP